MSSNPLSPPIFPYSWACEWGEDDYGLWQTLEISSVRQCFRWIEPGTFLMGSPSKEPLREPWAKDSETQHSVTLTRGFWLADTVVTQALWLAVMGGENPSYFQDDLQNPVEQVGWDDAQMFIERLNDLIPDLKAQLPSEAQWEYACRAGTTSPFSFGENITPELANYNGEYPYSGGEKGLYRQTTVPVKSLPANPWGLFEMHGNVWEWCQDVWQVNLETEAVNDPLTLGAEGGDRVLRSGSWHDYGWHVRSAFRNHDKPDERRNGIGFRLAIARTEL